MLESWVMTHIEAYDSLILKTCHMTHYDSLWRHKWRFLKNCFFLFLLSVINKVEVYDLLITVIRFSTYYDHRWCHKWGRKKFPKFSQSWCFRSRDMRNVKDRDRREVKIKKNSERKKYLQALLLAYRLKIVSLVDRLA